MSTHDERMDELNAELVRLLQELGYKPISAARATAAFMLYACLLQRHFGVSKEGLESFIDFSTRIHMEVCDAKSVLN